MWEDYQAQMTGILFVVLCLLPVSATDFCYSNASIIFRKEELFNDTNYKDVCFKRISGYEKALALCASEVINPKCVCALDMYDKRIFDLCKDKPGAQRKNGSIDHVTVEFCKNYSFNGNGPCQNGGELVVTNDLAIDAKCECKEGYYGRFCDSFNKSIVCSPSDLKPGSFPNCSEKFQASTSNPYCLLSLEAGYTFLCNAYKTATDEMEACTSAPEQFRGDSSKGLSIHTPDIVFIFTTLLLLIQKSSIV